MKNREMTITVEKLAKTIVSNYRMVQEGFMSEEAHFERCSAYKNLFGEEFWNETCELAMEMKEVGTIEVSDGFGKMMLALSNDKNANEIMKLIAEKFTFMKGKSVDDFIRKNEQGNYEVKVWNQNGRNWFSEYKFGRLATFNNNTNVTLYFVKVKKQWHGYLNERRSYGQPDIQTKLF